ncbi:hypothetical protein V6N11_068549 [Hibiscus sabdariffa]|uniref:Uncharacterized protein n=1 Tax=Hibiscus sabdariffa TaxID=183260 RepID=A0ABR2PA15_9ROSI
MGFVVFSLAVVLSIQFVVGHDEQIKGLITSEINIMKDSIKSSKGTDCTLTDVNADDIKTMGDEAEKAIESGNVNSEASYTELTPEEEAKLIEASVFFTSETMVGAGLIEPNVAHEVASSPEVLPELAKVLQESKEN